MTKPPTEPTDERAIDKEERELDKKAPETSADDTNASADQDIDTAGTDMDELSPTKSLGTGTAAWALAGLS